MKTLGSYTLTTYLGTPATSTGRHAAPHRPGLGDVAALSVAAVKLVAGYAGISSSLPGGRHHAPDAEPDQLDHPAYLPMPVPAGA